MDSRIQNSTQTQPTRDTKETTDTSTLIFHERLRIYKQHRRQANFAFYLAWGLAGISGLVGVAAVVLLFTGCVSEGIYTGLGGGMYSNATAICLKLAKDTNDRVDKDARALEEES
jgi:hypothetical protein